MSRRCRRLAAATGLAAALCLLSMPSPAAPLSDEAHLCAAGLTAMTGKASTPGGDPVESSSSSEEPPPPEPPPPPRPEIGPDPRPPADPTVGPDPSVSAAPAAAPAEEERRVYLLDRLAAGASIGYFTANRARILSEIHFDFPFVVLRQKSLYVRGSLETSTVKTGNRLRTDAFEAQDIEYLAEAGARDYLSNRLAIAGFLGQQGRNKLDQPLGVSSGSASGSAWIRYVGLGFESVGFPRPGGHERFEWRLAVGPVVDNDNAPGSDAVVRGAFLYDVWRGEQSSVGIDGSFDSLFDGLHGRTEYRVGPRWTFPLTNGIRATLFAEWIRGRNPLLLEDLQGWNFGFKYTEGAYAGPHTSALPDVHGILTFMRGVHRGFGRFDLDLSSPEIHIFSKPGRIFANLDANLVGGAGTDDLFYIAKAGIEVELHPRIMAGPYIYHRSNHAIGQIDDQATSLNVIQISLRTPGWEYANRLPGHLMPVGGRWYERIEGSLAPGIITNSTFSSARSWDLQAGARYDLVPRDRGVVPFVRLFGEWGDVIRREASIGFTTRQSLVIEAHYRRDSQYVGSDKSDVFLGGSLFF